MAVFSFARYFCLFGALLFFIQMSSSSFAQDLPVGGGSVAPPSDDHLDAANSEVSKKFVSSDGENMISAPSALEPVPEDDVFFDANDIVPKGEMVRSAPVKVNPVTQPGSKYIIVKKNYKADTKTANLVSAERALALGRYDSALVMFDNLYAVNKRDSRVLMGKAVALQKLGRFDEAMGAYEELSKVEPKNIDVKVNMLGLLGTRYPSIALRRLLGLYEKNKSNVALTAQIAIEYANTGDFNSALTYLGMASSMEPNNASHVFNMAVITEKAGDKKKAITLYEKALEIDTIYGAGRSIPRDAVYDRLAQIR